jgi:hypothetical protein
MRVVKHYQSGMSPSEPRNLRSTELLCLARTDSRLRETVGDMTSSMPNMTESVTFAVPILCNGISLWYISMGQAELLANIDTHNVSNHVVSEAGPCKKQRLQDEFLEILRSFLLGRLPVTKLLGQFMSTRSIYKISTHVPRSLEVDVRSRL